MTSVTLTPNAAGLSATTAAGAAYTVTPSAATGSGGFLASNYTITYTPYNGTVAAAAITITANNTTKAYGATQSTPVVGSTAYTISSGSLQNSETIGSVTLTYGVGALTAGSAAGATSSITPSAATGGTFTSSNYSITYVDGTLTVGATTFTWDGGDVDDNLWTSATNWVGDVAPIGNGAENLIFAGSTRLTPSNDFTANTSFASLSFASGAGNFSLSGSAIILNGGSTAITGNHTSGTMTIANNITYSTSAPTLTTLSGGTLTLSGTVDIGILTFTINNSGTVNITGNISGTTSTSKLTKSTGTGVLTLSGSNSYAGATTISAGTLVAKSTTAFGTAGVILSGATLSVLIDGVGNNGNGSELTFSNNLTINNATTGTINVDNNGSHTGNTVTFGTLTMGYGTTLNITGGNSYAFKCTSLSVTATLNSNPQTINPTTASFICSGNVAFIGNNHTLILDGTSSGNDISGIISQGAYVVSVTKSNSSTWTLSGANSYSGVTSINGGTLKLGATGDATNTPLGTTGAGTTVSSGATLDLAGFTLGTAEALTLNGNGVSSGGALINSAAATAASYEGAITLGSASSIGTTSNITLGSNGISGGYDLTKVGAATFHAGTGTVTLGSLAISAGTFTATSATTNISGDFSNSGTFNHNSGTLNFNGTTQAIASTTFNNLSISGGGTKTIGGDVMVNNTLTLTSGLIDVGTYTLTAAAISGGSSSSYILTGSAYNASPAGYLKIPSVNGAEKIFPVGTASSYNPCYITNSGTAQDFSVRVFTGVYVNGLSGAVASDPAKMVNRTWEITPTVQTGISAKIKLQWNAAEEGATFASQRSSALVSKNRHNHAGNDESWHQQSSDAVVSLGGGVYSQSTSSGITTFSTFAEGSQGSSLPIELRSFTARKYIDKIQLDWVTASETNNDYFTLERSTDGDTWTTIYTCEGAKTSTQEHSYSYSDYNTLVGILYYRLKQTDIDGKFTYSTIESVKFENETIIAQLYPMPAMADEINLVLQSIKTGTATVSISDMYGRQVCRGEVEVSTSPIHLKLADICTLMSGSYFITITNNDMVIRKKIVIE